MQLPHGPALVIIHIFTVMWNNILAVGVQRRWRWIGHTLRRGGVYNIKHSGGNPRARGMSGDPTTPCDAASRRRYGCLGRSSDELPRTERSGGRRLSAHASSEAKGLSERASELVGRTKGTDKTLLSLPSLLFPLPRFSLAKFRAGISVRSHRSETWKNMLSPVFSWDHVRGYSSKYRAAAVEEGGEGGGATTDRCSPHNCCVLS